MEYTKAPWKVVVEKNNIIITANFLNGTDGYSMPIAYMQTESNCKNSLENAKLMTSAPELLKACKFLMSFVPDWAKVVPTNLDPTFYGTLSATGDLKIKGRVDAIQALISGLT